MLRELTGTQFQPDELPSGRVAVMFAADWCGFSRRFHSHYKRVPRGWVVDISDEDDPLWDAFGIRVVPTVILFEDGAPARRWAGVLGERHVDEIQAALTA